MSKTHYSALLVVVAVVAGATWHNPLLFCGLMKNVFIAFVLARLAVRFRVCNCKAALQLGMGLWIGFQSVLLMSVVVNQRLPWVIYATHPGVLTRTVMMSVLIGGWPS
jgi:hypothetical protein